MLTEFEPSSIIYIRTKCRENIYKVTNWRFAEAIDKQVRDSISGYAVILNRRASHDPIHLELYNDLNKAAFLGMKLAFQLKTMKEIKNAY